MESRMLHATLSRTVGVESAVPGHGPCLRELISRGTTGFLALYRYVPRKKQVWILRIRGQRELDYRANIAVRSLSDVRRVACRDRRGHARARLRSVHRR